MSPTAELATFPGAGSTLRGFLHLPEGEGPFPAVVWGHGSESAPGSADELGRFFTGAGYALFAPHRRGHGESSGEYPIAAIRAGARGHRGEAIRRVIALHEGPYLEDTIAALRWISAQPFVDADRTAVAGVSHGGIQVLLAAEAGAGAGAYVGFAPAARAWRHNPEIADRLLAAVGAATAPILLLQAENDYSLGPSRELGAALERTGPPSRSRVYPSYGSSPESGHGSFALHGTDVWGREVRSFLEEVLD